MHGFGQVDNIQYCSSLQAVHNDWDLWGCGENTYLCSILHRWPCLHSQLANENEEKCNGKLQTHYYCFSCLAITYHIYHKWDSNGIWQFVRHIHSYRHHNGSQYSVILCFICRLEQAVISKHCVTEPPCWFALITENTLGYFNFSSSYYICVSNVRCAHDKIDYTQIDEDDKWMIHINRDNQLDEQLFSSEHLSKSTDEQLDRNIVMFTGINTC